MANRSYCPQQFFCAQTYLNMMSRCHYDGGCYVLSKEDYNQLLYYTVVRSHMVEELQILLAHTEAQLHHITRLIADNLPSSSRNQETYRLQESLIRHVQHFTGIKRRHYTIMLEVDPCPELQSIYQRRLSSRSWKPHRVPTRTRSCPSFRPQRYTARALLPYDYVQLRRGFSPTFEPTSD